MNVLVASHLYPSQISQTLGSFVHNQVRFLQAHCHLQVVAPTPWFPFPGFGSWSAYGRLPKRETRDGIDIERPRYLSFPRRLFHDLTWRSYLRALEHSCPNPPDIIHAHCIYPDGRAAVEYGHNTNRPVAITAHGFDIKELPSRGPQWRRLVIETLDQARLVIAISKDFEERILALGTDPEKIVRVPNGVDGELFQGTPGRRDNSAPWHLLYVGRFDPAKGIGILLEALGRLRQRRTDWKLTLIGGNSFTGTAQVFLRQTAELGLEDCVEFLDEITWTELPVHMAQADLFLLPSFSEGLPLSLLEALVSGLPVVSTRCGGYGSADRYRRRRRPGAGNRRHPGKLPPLRPQADPCQSSGALRLPQRRRSHQSIVPGNRRPITATVRRRWELI